MKTRKRDTINNSQDIIDSRDIIARLAELDALREDAVEAALDYAARLAALETDEIQETLTAEQRDEMTALNLAATWVAPDGVTLAESSDYGEDEEQERIALAELATKCEGYGDWRHGKALIRDSYFESYARDLAEDLYGKEMRDAKWPFDCIDWGQACEALQQDYMTVEFDGVTYWMRSC